MSYNKYLHLSYHIHWPIYKIVTETYLSLIASSLFCSKHLEKSAPYRLEEFDLNSDTFHSVLFTHPEKIFIGKF